MTHRGVYCYVCDLCDHPLSWHDWNRDDQVDLYECTFTQECDCVVPLKSPSTGISRAEYERRFLIDRADDLGANTMGAKCTPCHVSYDRTAAKGRRMSASQSEG